MDYSKFIEEDHLKDPQKNTYCILFMNRCALEIDEIKEIFSAFGSVVSVRCTGDKNGYRFVRYKTFEEARNAIDGLKHHQKIFFAQPRNKNKSNRENHDSSKNKGDKNRNNDERRQFKHDRANENRYQSNSSINSFYSSKDSQKGSISSNSSNSMREKLSNLAALARGDVNIKKNTFKSNPSQENVYNHSSNSNKRNNTTSRNPKPSNSLIQKLSTLPPITNGLDKVSIKSSDNDEIPGLMVPNTKNSPDVNKQKKDVKYFDASEVIVANIHPDYGAPYILHLLERFEPLGISKIVTTPNSNVRYCHVYFKTLQDSEKVEKSFDHTELSGERLIVLRSSQLVKQTTQ